MSLIEVLVAMMVISIGALSATSLQIVTKRTNRDAAQRLEATHLASTVVERMRANNSSTALAQYVALGQYSTSVPRPLGGGRLAELLATPGCSVDNPLACCPQGTSCCVPGTNCDGQQVAQVELYQLEYVMDGLLEKAYASKTGGLDQPTACISGPATGADGFYTITIAFRGATAMPVDTGVSCGLDATATAGLATYKLYGDNNEYRRTLTVTAYIAPSVLK
jgi:prepilin-type N-terminal cleavage/methylation domain-containing protein